MSERREYMRINIGASGILYCNDREIPVTIHDISENGIGFLIPEDYEPIEFLDSVNEVKFSYVDEYQNLAGKTTTSYINGEAVAVHYHFTPQNQRVIGCRLKANNVIEEYVRSRKTIDYLKNPVSFFNYLDRRKSM